MRFRNLTIAILTFVIAIGTGAAQTGTITGQVLDPTGAVVSKAQITAKSSATGTTRTVKTTSAGIYSLPALPPAIYDVTVNAQGFQIQTKENVILNVAATLPLDFNLAVAGATAEVDVREANTVAVETDNYQLSTVINAQQINELPLVLRDPYQLVLLSPGAVTAANNNGGVSVNGQRDRNNNFMLDGADNNDTSVPGGLSGASSANPDSTQEFRVITNNFDAEFGRNTGAIIDVITRGGTNSFHGDAYEFGRYNALGARDYFNRKADGPQDPYVRNDFGASVGGPVWKDHTFFFLNGEAQRFRTTRTASQTTPTAAFKTGKFTYIDPYDKSETAVDLTNPATNPNNLSGLSMDPTISKIFAITPVGQIDNGDGVSTTYNFPSPNALNGYTFTGRFDQKLTAKHQLTARYIYGHSNESDPSHDETLPGYGAVASIGTNHNVAISVASALSANKANLFRAGYNQIQAGYYCDHAAIDTLLGVDNFGNGRDINIPYFFGGNAFGCYDLGYSNSQARLSSTLLFADTFTMVKGAHTIKFGGEYRSVKDTSYDNFSSRDLLSLDTYSENSGISAYNFAGDPDSTSIRSFEDMIWGAQGTVANATEYQFFTSDGTRRANDISRFRQHEWDLFAQDTWKVNSHLTASIGLRYAYNGVPYENDGNFSSFFGDASASVPASGYFSFTKVGPGTGHQLYADSWTLIEPRVGFAYDLHGDGKTAIRGGFGIFHDRVFDNIFGNARSNPPFQASYNAYPYDGTTSTPTVTTYPNPGDMTPSANISNGDYNEPVVIDSKLKMPTAISYNIGVQHQLSRSLTVELNYVGSHSTHGLRQIDGAPPQPDLVAARLADGVLPSALTFTALYTGGQDANGMNFDPAVNNTAFYHELYQTSIVNSNYNALQAKLQGQFHGLTLTGSYTYSHSLDNGADSLVPGAGGSASPRNSFDLKPEYGSSDFDVRHRGTAAVSYNLPIGNGKAYLNKGIVGYLLEGIELSGIEQVQTGMPFDLRGTVDNLHTSVTNRPELVGKPYPSGRGKIVSSGKIVGPNVKAFANAPYGESVSIHRNKFYGPGYVNTDAVFQKTQTLHGPVKLVFRAESYNVLNHPNMEAPPFASLGISSPTFGIAQKQVGQNDGTTGARQIQGALKLVF